ncbi:hypothetical protein HDV63DRAFT_390615 [Trichoderma sp. SZMC 28014]
MASNAVHNNNAAAAPPAAPPVAASGCTQATVSLIPADPAFTVRRFLSAQDQHSPLGLRQASTEAEAESKMLEKLRAFDEKFSDTSARN